MIEIYECESKSKTEFHNISLKVEMTYVSKEVERSTKNFMISTEKLAYFSTDPAPFFSATYCLEDGGKDITRELQIGKDVKLSMKKLHENANIVYYFEEHNIDFFEVTGRDLKPGDVLVKLIQNTNCMLWSFRQQNQFNSFILEFDQRGGLALGEVKAHYCKFIKVDQSYGVHQNSLGIVFNNRLIVLDDDVIFIHRPWSGTYYNVLGELNGKIVLSDLDDGITLLSLEFTNSNSEAILHDYADYLNYFYNSRSRKLCECNKTVTEVVGFRPLR